MVENIKQSSSADGKPKIHNQKKSFAEKYGPNTIFGRNILTTVLLVMFAMLFASVLQSRLSEASRTNAIKLQDREKIRKELGVLRNLSWILETRFQAYMLSPNKNKHKLVDLQLKSINQFLDAFSKNELVQVQSLNSKIKLYQIKSKALENEIINTMVLRADPLKLFPAMPILVEVINPAATGVFTNLTLAMREKDDEIDGKQRAINYKIFNVVRYFWLRQINTFRLLVSARIGMFSNSPELAMKAQMADIDIYKNEIDTELKKLTSLDNANLLGFQQSDSLRRIVEYRNVWNNAYLKVSKILLSPVGWRNDTTAVKTNINPLFNSLWSLLREIGGVVAIDAAEDIHNIQDVADSISSALWLISIVICTAGVLNAFAYDFQVRRPLVKVSKALLAEANGETNIELPKTKLYEARDLISAFAKMRKKIFIRQEHLQSILCYSAESIITVDRFGVIKSANPAAEKLFGYNLDELVEQNLRMLLPEKYCDEYDSNFSSYLTSAACKKISNVPESIGLHKNGKEIPVILHVTEMYVDNEQLFLGMLSDGSERRGMLDNIKAREQRLRSILDNTAEGIITFNKAGVIESWNESAQNLFGWTEEEAVGCPIAKYIVTSIAGDEDNSSQFTNMEKLDFCDSETDVTGKRKNGSTFPVSVKVGVMELDPETKYTALIANISERKIMMDNLRYLAEHDGLTGLFNRAYFQGELEKIVMQVKQEKGLSYALLYIDLDNFKYVNDTLGHAAGDKILVDVTTILQRRTRRGDILARLGGDEFVVLLSEVKRDDIKIIAETFRQQMDDYVLHYEGKIVDIGCSIGASFITHSVESVRTVMSQADVACHLAKRAGRNRVHLYSEKDQGDVESMSSDMGWSHRIKKAVEHNSFVLVLQSIVNSSEGKLECYEVLIRMKNSDGSLISPIVFIPTSERFGLASKIDLWVVEHAIKYLAIIRQHNPEIRFSVNLSAQSLTDPEVLRSIPFFIKKYNLQADALTFEVTETAAISDISVASSFLIDLQKLGCLTSIDDFGSGMASFAYLRELSVDIVKIDGRFVKNLTNSDVDQSMVKAMNDISHALGKKTVAEFVEDKRHFELIREIGIDYAQGYYFDKPRLIEEIFPFIEQDRDEVEVDDNKTKSNVVPFREANSK